MFSRPAGTSPGGVFLVKAEHAADKLHIPGGRLGIRLFEEGDGLMGQLADKPVQHGLQGVAGFLVDRAKPPEGTLQFLLRVGFKMGEQVHNGGLQVQRIQPEAEGVHFIGHDSLRLFGLNAAVREVFFNHFFKIVDVVEVDVVEIIHIGIDVVGDGDVDKKTWDGICGA